MGKNTTLHNVVLFLQRSHFKNSCIVFHHDFQTCTLENNKSTRPLSSVFSYLEVVMKHSHSFLEQYIYPSIYILLLHVFLFIPQGTTAIAYDAVKVIHEAVNEELCSSINGSAITSKDRDAMLTCMKKVNRLQKYHYISVT